jgi:hypothetical protein
MPFTAVFPQGSSPELAASALPLIRLFLSTKKVCFSCQFFIHWIYTVNNNFKRNTGLAAMVMPATKDASPMIHMHFQWHFAADA